MTETITSVNWCNLRAPTLASYVTERHRIYGFLSEALGVKVIFVSAPPGWGKTTAVASWLRQAKMPSAWISLDEYDNSGERLLPSLLEAAKTIDDGIDLRLKNFFANRPEFSNIPREKIQSLAKNLANDERIRILIIDDFHLLNNKIENETLLAFIKNTPDNWKFIILSRSAPPDYFNYYGIIRKLEVITAKHLRFTPEETEEYYCKSGILLDEKDLQEIIKTTDGWAAAMNAGLMALKLGGKIAEMRTHNLAIGYLDKYIMEELFIKWDRRIQTFWVKISLLNSMNARLAMALTGQADAERILDSFAENGSFISKIGDDSYRLHHLFQNFLQKQIKAFDIDAMAIYRSTARWYENNNLPYEAAEYYIKACCFEDVALIIEKLTEQFDSADSYYALEHLILKLPDEIILKSPVLCSAMAIIHSLNYRINDALKWYENLVNLKQSLADNDPRRKELDGRITYTKMHLPFVGDIELSDIFKELDGNTLRIQQITLTGTQPSFFRGSKDLSSWGKQAVSMRVLMKPLLEKLFAKSAVGATSIGIAEYYYERNMLSKSLLELVSGIAECEENGIIDTYFVGNTLMARLMCANGQLCDYKTLMANVKKQIDKENALHLIPNWRAVMVRFQLLDGDIASAEKWHSNYGPDLQEGFKIMDRYQYMTKAKLYIATQQYEKALTLLSRLNNYFVDYKRTLDLIECTIMQAICFDFVNEEEAALQKIGVALNLAQPYQYIRVFADEGERARQILSKYLKWNKYDATIKPSYIRELLTVARTFAKMYPKYYAPPVRIRNAELTRAEQEILLLLSQGLSNKEIGEFLNIKLPTVKSHTSNIYAKLGTKSRTAAIKTAKELKII